MEREEEIITLLRSLLERTENAIDKNQYSPNDNKVIISCENVVRHCNRIEKYLIELKKLQS